MGKREKKLRVGYGIAIKLALLVSIVLWGGGYPPSGVQAASSGGTVASGGTSAAGGSVSSSSAFGGTSTTGGTRSAGGSISSGGTVALGGSTSGGSTASGGSTTTGCCYDVVSMVNTPMGTYAQNVQVNNVSFVVPMEDMSQNRHSDWFMVRGRSFVVEFSWPATGAPKGTFSVEMMTTATNSVRFQHMAGMSPAFLAQQPNGTAGAVMLDNLTTACPWVGVAYTRISGGVGAVPLVSIGVRQ